MRQSCKHDIQRAVISLLAESELDRITVTEVTERAGVSRTSYYRHYQSLRDVIDDYFDDLGDELAEIEERVHAEQVDDTPLSRMRIIREMLKCYQAHCDDLSTIFRSDLRGSAMERIYKRILRYFQRQSLIERLFAIEDACRAAWLEHYMTGGLTDLICTWIVEGCKNDPEVLLSFVLEVHHLTLE